MTWDVELKNNKDAARQRRGRTTGFCKRVSQGSCLIVVKDCLGCGDGAGNPTLAVGHQTNETAVVLHLSLPHVLLNRKKHEKHHPNSFTGPCKHVNACEISQLPRCRRHAGAAWWREDEDVCSPQGIDPSRLESIW